MSERVRRAFERVLMPWFSREEHEREVAHNAQIERRSTRARMQADAIRRDYLLAAERLRR